MPIRKDDLIVSKNIRLARIGAGKSQTEVANALGLTFQQVQKYEKGVNRISAGVLLEIARVLNVSVTSLLDGCGGTNTPPKPDALVKLGMTRDGAALATAFNRIEKPSLRRAIVHLAEASGQ